jgi:hypothetical protein
MAPEPHWQAALDDWLNGASLQTPAALKMRLKEFVPEYSPQL